MSYEFKGTSPCNTCPYRKDVPLQTWDKSEFKKLLDSENDIIGAVYGCHKKNNTVCKGWLMDQDKRHFPSVALRMLLTRKQITREYLDKLKCKAPIYASVKQMANTNYPELRNHGHNI